MAQINLVTGYTGEAHIKSEEDALLNRFLLGSDNAVINLISDFNETDCDIDCDAIIDGRLVRTNGTVNLTFSKPTSGYYRYDAVYIVYKKDTQGIETAELQYCEGIENESSQTAAQNIGQPTFDASIAFHYAWTLISISWDNQQTIQEIRKNLVKPSMLWQGSAQPLDTDTLQLVRPISSLTHGIILVFDFISIQSAYNAPTSVFIPKSEILSRLRTNYPQHSVSLSCCLPLPAGEYLILGSKTLEIYDDYIKGKDINNGGTHTVPTDTNIMFDNSSFTLVRIYGI